MSKNSYRSHKRRMRREGFVLEIKRVATESFGRKSTKLVKKWTRARQEAVQKAVNTNPVVCPGLQPTKQPTVRTAKAGQGSRPHRLGS